jgi:hypothetical protein
MTTVLSLLPTDRGEPTAGRPQSIRAFFKVNTDFCTGGQPRLEHFATLKADGAADQSKHPANTAPPKSRKLSRRPG